MSLVDPQCWSRPDDGFGLVPEISQHHIQVAVVIQVGNTAGVVIRSAAVNAADNISEKYICSSREQQSHGSNRCPGGQNSAQRSARRAGMICQLLSGHGWSFSRVVWTLLRSTEKNSVRSGWSRSSGWSNRTVTSTQGCGWGARSSQMRTA